MKRVFIILALGWMLLSLHCNFLIFADAQQCPTTGMQTCDYSASNICNQDPSGLTCGADEWCGVISTADYTNGVITEIYAANINRGNNQWVLPYGSATNAANKACPSGSSLVDTLPLVTATKNMFYSSSCFIFKYSHPSITPARVQYSGVWHTLEADSVIDKGSCGDGAYIFVQCDGKQRYYKTRSDTSSSTAKNKVLFSSPVCYRQSPSRSWDDRSGTMEDFLVFARLTYPEAKAYCEANGAVLYYGAGQDTRYLNPTSTSLYKAATTSYGNPVKTELTRFWVGIENNKWTFDGSNYDSNLQPQAGSTGSDMYVVKKYKNSTKRWIQFEGMSATSASMQRNHFGCTRNRVRMSVIAPLVCYKGGTCRFSLSMATIVATYMHSQSIIYRNNFGTGTSYSVSIPVGLSSGYIDYTIPSCCWNSTATQTFTLYRGVGVVDSNTSASITIADQEAITATFDTSIIIGSKASGNLTLSTPSGKSVVWDVNITISSTCPLVISPSVVTLVAGSANVVNKITVAPPVVPVTAATTCQISFSYSNSIQYASTNPSSFSFIVAPFVVPSFSELSAAMTVNTLYTFKITVSSVYMYQAITLTPTCSGATIAPLSQTYNGNTPRQFTISKSTAGTCTFNLAVSNTGAYQVNSSIVMPSVTFTYERVILTSIAPLLYVGGGGLMTISCNLSSSTSITIVGTWLGAPGATNYSNITVVLSPTAQTASILVGAYAASSGANSKYSFTMNPVVTGYVAGIDPAPLETRFRTTPSASPATLPSKLSIGTYEPYVTTLTVTIYQLPTAGNDVNISFVYNAAHFSVTPSYVTWSGSETAYSTRSFTIAAIAPTPTSNPGEHFSYIVTGTDPQFVYGQVALGRSIAYNRQFAQTVETKDVYGANVVFTLTVTVSVAPTFGSLNITVTFPATKISGPSLASIKANELSTTLSYVTLSAAAGSPRLDITYAIATSTNNSVKEIYDPRINTSSILVLPYLPIIASCNASVLFYGPNNAIVCMFNITTMPPSGTSLQLTPRETTSVTSPSGAAQFSTSMLQFMFLPTLSFSFTDGASSSFSLAVADTSKRYNPGDLNFDFTCRKLVTVNIRTFAGDSIFISAPTAPNPFLLCVKLSEAPSSNETIVIPISINTMSTNVTSLIFNSSKPVEQCFTTSASVPGTVPVTFGVSGSMRFVAVTNTLSLVVKELSAVSMTVTPDVIFVGQTSFMEVSIGLGPNKGNLTLRGELLCNGELVEGAVNGISWSGIESAVSGAVETFAQCLNGTIRFNVTGTTTNYDMSVMPTVAFEIRPRKIINASLDLLTLYSGGIDSRTLAISMPSLPYLASSEMTVSITAVPSNLLSFQFSSFDYAPTSTASFVNRSTTIKVTGPETSQTVVHISIAITGSAITEYLLGVSNTFNITVMPIVVANFTLGFTSDTIYVSPKLQQPITVTIPIAPRGQIIVTPVFLQGSSTDVLFTPDSAILNSSIMSQTFMVCAMAATSSNEALSVTYNGDAVEYFPQPAAPSFPIKFRVLGTVSLLEAVPASFFQTTSFTLYLQLSYEVPAGWGSVTVNIMASSNAITVGTSSVVWAEGEKSQRQVVISGVNSGNVQLYLSLDSGTPPIYTSLLPANSTIDVLSCRSSLCPPTDSSTFTRATPSISRDTVTPTSSTLTLSVSNTSDVAESMTTEQQRISKTIEPTNSLANCSIGVICQFVKVAIGQSALIDTCKEPGPTETAREFTYVPLAKYIGNAAKQIALQSSYKGPALPSGNSFSYGSVDVLWPEGMANVTHVAAASPSITACWVYARSANATEIIVAVEALTVAAGTALDSDSVPVVLMKLSLDVICGAATVVFNRTIAMERPILYLPKKVFVPDKAVQNTATTTGALSVTVGAVAVPIAAMQQGVALALLRMAQCEENALNGEPLDVSVHPLQFGLGGGAGKYGRGALIGNLLLIPAIWCALMYLLAPFAIRALTGRTLDASRDFVGWPGMALMPLAVLSEGSAMSSVGLLTQGSVGDIIMGLIGFAILLVTTACWSAELWRMRRQVVLRSTSGVAIWAKVFHPRFEWHISKKNEVNASYLDKRIQLVGSSWWLWSSLAAQLLSVVVGVAEGLPIGPSLCRARWAVASLAAVLQAAVVMTNTVPVELLLIGVIGAISCILVLLIALSTFEIVSPGSTFSALNAVSMANSILGIALLGIGACTSVYENFTQQSRRALSAQRHTQEPATPLSLLNVPLIPPQQASPPPGVTSSSSSEELEELSIEAPQHGRSSRYTDMPAQWASILDEADLAILERELASGR